MGQRSYAAAVSNSTRGNIYSIFVTLLAQTSPRQKFFMHFFRENVILTETVLRKTVLG